MDLLIHTKHNLLIFNNLNQIRFWKKHSDYFFTGVYMHIYVTDCIWWYNHLGHITTENMKIMGEVDTSDLVIIRWVISISSRSPNLEWASLTHTTSHIAKDIRRVTERINFMLDALSTEYTQQAYTHASRIFHSMCSRQVSKSAEWW